MEHIIFTSYDGDHLESDLSFIRENSNNASGVNDADLLDAFLTQISENEELCWKLVKWESENNTPPFFNCKAINCFQEKGYNVYRLRPTTSLLKKYRIIYALNAQDNEIHYLAIAVKRPDRITNATDPYYYDYEPDHPISKRIFNEYDASGLPKIR